MKRGRTKETVEDNNKEMKPFDIIVQLFWEGHKNLPHGFDAY